MFEKKIKDNNKIIYSSNLQIKQIQSNIMIILTYIFLIFLWQYTLSFQSSMFTLMNTCVFLMFAFGTVALFACAEERENIIKHTKNQIIYYLLVTFIYDMFFRIVLSDIMIGSALGDVDPSLMVAKNFVVTLSTIIKIGFPIAYIVWIIQKLGIFRSGMSKARQMEKLRDIRKNPKSKLNINNDDDIDDNRV